MIFRNSIRNGTEFYYQWRKSHLMTSWKDCTNWGYESLRNSRPYWNCMTWRLIRRKQELIITDWRQWWREVSSKTYEIRILGPEMEIMKETPWSRIREQNSVYKEFLEIVGSGKPTGSVQKETIAVSATISISVGKLHHQIRLRILSCSRMSENHRGPEVPEAEVPVVECLDGLARITLEELAITHFVKNGTLQNACSTRPRAVVGLGKSALVRIARLMNSFAKSPKIMVAKVQWPCWTSTSCTMERWDPLWNGGGRLVGQGLHYTSLHTPCAHAGSRDTAVAFLFCVLTSFTYMMYICRVSACTLAHVLTVRIQRCQVLEVARYWQVSFLQGLECEAYSSPSPATADYTCAETPPLVLRTYHMRIRTVPCVATSSTQIEATQCLPLCWVSLCRVTISCPPSFWVSFSQQDVGRTIFLEDSAKILVDGATRTVVAPRLCR